MSEHQPGYDRRRGQGRIRGFISDLTYRLTWRRRGWLRPMTRRERREAEAYIRREEYEMAELIPQTLGPDDIFEVVEEDEES